AHDETLVVEEDKQSEGSKPKSVKKETTNRKRTGDNSGEPSSKRSKSINLISDDEPEVTPLPS
ncbi:hypothetical protein A2U01_0084058, partial [Trifolium medium]|nr:hypothetical protein [Trifolium medium]